MFKFQLTGRLTHIGVSCALFAGVFLSPEQSFAQNDDTVLDEITVTAQRRTQNLRDVPISIQTFNGDEITRQGFITLNELTNFTPGLIIKDFSEEQGMILRGAGTQSKNLGVEQGVPTFVDGIHFGRGSQVKNGFLDLEQIEVLKGPQPVFFGQNAAAGALNITTRKPTENWQGYASGEFGTFGKTNIEGAFGGPITDTLGIRVAAKHYSFDGFLNDFLTGEDFPERETTAGRATLHWAPTEQFSSTLKVEYADNDLGPRAYPVAFDRFFQTPFLPHGERVLITGLVSQGIPGANQVAGQFTDLGYRYGPNYIDPWVEVDASGIPITEASGSDSGVVYDFNECRSAGGLEILTGGFDPTDPTVLAPVTDAPNPTAGRRPERPSQFEACNMNDESASRPWHSILDLNYTFDNGIEVESKSAFSAQTFYNTPFNSGGGAFATNPRARGEDFEQISTELRFSSEVGGKYEWMAGLYWQKNDLYAWSDAYRANSRRSIRTMRAAEESTWTSLFATLTINFMDDKASLDIGGRFTDISKDATGSNQIAEWFVLNEVAGGGDGSIVRVPYGLDWTQGGARGVASRDFLLLYPGIVNGSIVGRTPFSSDCSSFLGSVHPAGNISSSRCASVASRIDDDSFDPQVVFRYRPNDNVSLYAKYATSFKSGAFDMGVSEVARFEDTFTFGPEEYEIWEVGMRGTFLNGRLALDATAYVTDIEGVQVSFIDRVLDRNITKNVAEQESDGLEFSVRFAATERLTLGANAAFLDATVVSFPDAVCTEDERITGRCRSEQDSIDLVGDDSLEGTIDRSGVEARNAPDWQFTGNLRYELPTIVNGYTTDLDLTFLASSDYTTDRSFSRVVYMDSHEDLNVTFNIASDDGFWSLMFYGRNLLEPTPTYDPGLDLAGDGLLGSEAQLTTVNFATYGARLSVNFE